MEPVIGINQRELTAGIFFFFTWPVIQILALSHHLSRWFGGTYLVVGLFWMLYPWRRSYVSENDFKLDGSLFLIAVDSDEKGITVTDPHGAASAMTWDELDRIVVRTTDQGPLLSDVLWEMRAGDGREVIFPGDAVGNAQALAEFQRRLQGFDNDQLVAAMGCTQNRQFLLWQRSESTPQG